MSAVTILTALFVTFVVLTNTVGVKLFEIGGRILPVSILWYPLTFLVTDVVSETYGSRRDLIGIILSVYAIKVLIAAADTPLCYLGVRVVERYTGVRGVDIA